MTAIQDALEDAAVLPIVGPLYAPVCAALAADVRVLLGSGRRVIVLDLAAVTAIDAAGMGALVHVHNMATSADGVLRIVNTSGEVRDLLTRVGLEDLLDAKSDKRSERHGSRDRQAAQAKSSV